MKYSSRIIPRLPPKQLMLDAFLEDRRLGLQRWLRLMSQHPVMSNDEMLRVFLTDTSGEQQTLMDVAFSRDSDEFEHSPKSETFSTYDFGYLINQRDLMRSLLSQVIKIKRLMEQQAKREHNQSVDFAEMSEALRSITSDTNDNFLQDFSSNFSEFAKQSKKVSTSQQQAVAERLSMVIEVFSAHLDMCDRVEKSISCNFQAPNKSVNINSLILSKVIRGTSDDDKTIDDSNQNDLESIRKKKAFSLQCVMEETRLAHNYLKLLPSIILQFSNEEAKGFANFSEIFNKIVQVESDKLN